MQASFALQCIFHYISYDRVACDKVQFFFLNFVFVIFVRYAKNGMMNQVKPMYFFNH